MDQYWRTINAMEGKKVDRVPVNFYRHLFTFGNNEESMINGQIKWFHESHMDFLLEETDGYMEYPISGDPLNWSSWKDISQLSDNSVYFTNQIERTKRLIDGINGACLFYIAYTPFSTIKHTTHNEYSADSFLIDHKDKIQDIMKVIEDTNNRLLTLLNEQTDITGFFISLQNGEPERFSFDTYKEYLSPWDERLLATANSLSTHNITHMCSWAGSPNDLRLWQNYDYKVVNWSVNIEKNMNMKQARAFFKPGTVLMGGFDNRPNAILHVGSRQDIYAETIKQLDMAGSIGTILCGDCSVQNDQSAKQIQYVVDATKEYSQSQTPTQ